MRHARLIKIFLIVTLFLALVGFSSFLYYNYDVPILMYHHIAAGPEGNSLYVSPENFEKQMKYLYDNKYQVMSIDQILIMIKQGLRRPRHAVAITFDDGYKDNYTHAFKILKKYNFSAAVFVSMDLIGKKGYLSQQELEEMAQDDIIIGSHTLNHAYLPGLSDDEVMRQLKVSKEILTEKFNPRVITLAYPVGGFSKEIQEFAKLAGYEAAFSTNRGIKKSRRNEDLYAIRRIKIKDSASHFVLWAKLSGYYNLFRKVKDPY